MYIPSFFITKILFVVTAILDAFAIYAYFKIVWLATWIKIVLCIAIVLCKIPVGIVSFWYFNRRIVHLSSTCCLATILINISAIIMTWIYALSKFKCIMLAIIFTGVMCSNIFLEIILTFNIYILKTFLITDVNIPSNMNILKYPYLMGGLSK